jgi:hypothetical protein
MFSKFFTKKLGIYCYEGSFRVILDRLAQATLARVFRGELVPKDSKDEPAGGIA